MKRLFLVCAILLSACGSDGSDPTPPPVQTDAFVEQVTAVAATAPDDTEPIDIEAIAGTAPEDSEPLAI